MTHYIHRPTPEGGETDQRFRDIRTSDSSDIRLWFWGRDEWVSVSSLVVVEDVEIVALMGFNAIWQMPGPDSDAPSDETLALARAEKEKA